MSHEDTQETTQTLGNFLREQRKQKGLSLAEVNDATKISLPILKAMEEDEYERMPADAFCRGFYSMYARFLELAPQAILEQYLANREIHPKTSLKTARPPVRKSQHFTNYAQPSTVSPATSVTLFVIVCCIIAIGACWYFNFNPADYIHTKLIPPQTSIEDVGARSSVTPQTTPLFVTTPSKTDTVEPLPEKAIETDGVKTEETILPEISSGTNEEMLNNSLEETKNEASAVAPYHLQIDFKSSGVLRVTLDDGFVLDKQFSAGTSLQWKVEKKIILDMPELLNGTLTLNGIEIPLPEAKNGRRLLSLPEDLLN